MMRSTLVLAVLTATSAGLMAEDGARKTAATENAQVLFFGTFHFSNPGRDVVKTEQVDVTSEENQAYLVELSRRLALEFRPTVVLLEYNPEAEEEMTERYRAYLAGDFELPVNEVYQLGFRVAKLAGLETIHSYDERNVHWQAQPLFDEMKSGDPAAQARFDGIIERITRETQEAHATLSLPELLALHNNPEKDDLNKSIYIQTNHVGAGESFSGADATASWWRRNFRMYAHVQRHGQPGERVLAIGGQGHTAILKELLRLDPEREAIDVRDFL